MLEHLLEYQSNITQAQEDWFDESKRDAWLGRPK